MILYALIVTFFLGWLVRPVAINYLALRKEEIAEAKLHHPSNKITYPDGPILTPEKI